MLRSKKQKARAKRFIGVLRAELSGDLIMHQAFQIESALTVMSTITTEGASPEALVRGGAMRTAGTGCACNPWCPHSLCSGRTRRPPLHGLAGVWALFAL